MRRTVREYLLNEHSDLITTVLSCADCVVASHGTFTVSAGPADPLREQLDRATVTERLSTVLAGAAERLRRPLAAEPVAAPPYVVITNVGPVMRATFEDRRLVITIEAFCVRGEHTDGVSHRYVRTTNTPADVLTIELREQR